MGKLVLTNLELHTPGEILRPATLEAEGGVIQRIYRGKISQGEDLRGAIVAPGFVDIHIHGYGGFDTNAGDPEELLSLAELLPRFGVTAFLPTAVTAPHQELLRVCRALAEAMESQRAKPTGARILGLHLEGPYLNPAKAGAQNPEFIREPSWREFREYWEACGGRLKAITVAPELPGALEFIEKAAGLGVVVSIGHTAASYERTWEAIRAGARRATHLFNAMTPIHHRTPGAAVACLLAPEVVVELICDLVHVAPPMLRLAWKAAGPERIAVVSDAIPPGGLPDGEYVFGGRRVEVRKGVAWAEEGTLAGGTLCLDRAVRNLHSLGIPSRDVLLMVTSVPAQAAGLGGVGVLGPGAPADFLVLDPELNLERVYVAGTRHI